MQIRLFTVMLATIFLAALTSAVAVGAAADGKPATTQSVGGIDAKDGASITGIVRFKGTIPAMKPIEEITGNAFCRQCYPEGKPPMHDEIVLGKNGPDDTLQNVLVYVSKGLEGKEFDPPKDAVLLDQAGCVYTPHVVAVMAGQPLEIRNSDATLHNVMASPRQNPPFNFGMPSKDDVVKKVFKQPELKINFHCFMHPWMSAYVHVLEHPFFAVTGADGAFTIRGLPPGEYEITVLHVGSLLEPTRPTASVKVQAGETKKVDFDYRTAGEKKGG
jgi:plastocyanin